MSAASVARLQSVALRSFPEEGFSAKEFGLDGLFIGGLFSALEAFCFLDVEIALAEDFDMDGPLRATVWDLNMTALDIICDDEADATVSETGPLDFL